MNFENTYLIHIIPNGHFNKEKVNTYDSLAKKNMNDRHKKIYLQWVQILAFIKCRYSGKATEF